MIIKLFLPLFITIAGIISLIFGILRLKINIDNLTNQKFKRLIERSTKSSLVCFLLGIGLTAIAQSSSAITIITLTFLANGFINKEKALLIIVGSNVGTTTTSIIVGFNFQYIYILFLILGIVFLLIVENGILTSIGKVLICLGCIFLGLELMSKGLNQLILIPRIYNCFTFTSKYPFLNLLFGIFITTIVQSSSATIAIIQNFFHLDLISLPSAVAFVLGANIGTTITGYFVGVTKSKDVLIVSTINLLFNIIGAILFYLILNYYCNFITYLSQILTINKFHVISLSHFLFNFITSIIFVVIILLGKIKGKHQVSNSCVFFH